MNDPVAEVQSIPLLDGEELFVKITQVVPPLPVGTKLYTQPDRLLIDAARKVVRVHKNGQPKQMDDAVLLLRHALENTHPAPAVPEGEK